MEWPQADTGQCFPGFKISHVFCFCLLHNYKLYILTVIPRSVGNQLYGDIRAKTYGGFFFRSLILSLLLYNFKQISLNRFICVQDYCTGRWKHVTNKNQRISMVRSTPEKYLYFPVRYPNISKKNWKCEKSYLWKKCYRCIVLALFNF